MIIFEICSSKKAAPRRKQSSSVTANRWRKNLDFQQGEVWKGIVLYIFNKNIRLVRNQNCFEEKSRPAILFFSIFEVFVFVENILKRLLRLYLVGKQSQVWKKEVYCQV